MKMKTFKKYKLFLCININNSTYYQKNRDAILKRAKYYYYNNTEAIRKKT